MAVYTTAGLLIATSSLSEVWSSINSIQMLAYIYHMNLFLPVNAERYFRFLLEIADFQIVNTEEIYDKMFSAAKELDHNQAIIEDASDSRLQAHDDSPTDEQPKRKVDSATFVERVAPILLQALICLIILIGLAILASLALIDSRIRQSWRKARNTVFWNGTLRTYIEGYLPATFELFSQLKAGFNWSSPVFYALDIYQVVQLVLTLVLPLTIFIYLRKHTHEFRKGQFKRRFGDTVGSLTHRRRSSANYVLLFCLTRLCFAAFIVFFAEAWSQVTATIFVI